MPEISEKIERRQSLKLQAEAIENERKALDKEIEEELGEGTHEINGYSVAIGEKIVSRFDGKRFEEENSELYAQYKQEKKEHYFKIVALKKD